MYKQADPSRMDQVRSGQIRSDQVRSGQIRGRSVPGALALLVVEADGGNVCEDEVDDEEE